MFFKIKSKEYSKLSSRIDDLDRKMKVLELDLDLYIKRLRASRGLGKFKKDDEEEEEETKDLKSEVYLSPDGTFLTKKQKKRIS